MKHFDEMGLLHEKAGCEGWILHETADSGLDGVAVGVGGGGGAGAGGQVR